MTMHAVVFGAGMVGSVIAEDLMKSGFAVTIADRSGDALARVSERSNGDITIQQVDCSNQNEVGLLAEKADIVFGALPSWLGLQALETVIKSGKSYCDVSFMAEDPRNFDQLAMHQRQCLLFLRVIPLRFGYCNQPAEL